MDDHSNQPCDEELSADTLTRLDGGATAYQLAGRQGRGNPTTAADDVVVDGRIITGENYES